MLPKKGVKIKLVISILVVIVIIGVAITSWYSYTYALGTALKDYSQENNYRYAEKISNSTSELIHNIRQNLSALANKIGQQDFTQSEIDNWYAASSQYYNSLFTTDSNGVVQLMTPQVVLGNQNSVQPGTKIETNLMKKALEEKKPFISDPYLAQTGNLMILISNPIFDNKGQYKGAVNGTIYLESESSLQRILTQPEYNNESFVFVVDRTGKIIYHPDSIRINELVVDHPLIQNVIQGKSGYSEIENSSGIKYFTGYAFLEETGWGIITQTPTTVIEEPLRSMSQKMIIPSLPLLLLIILLAWIFTNRITTPINQLAQFSKDATLAKNKTSICNLKIKSNIFEIRELCQYFLKHIQLLNNQIQLDGLTGLYNRRSFDLQMEKLVKHKRPFSMIMLDIDYFKRVNDQYGHLVGDDVLRYLALSMKDMCRDEDLIYRYGGEEFAILLMDLDIKGAYTLAERLRRKIAETPSPTGEPITISLGITTFKDDQNPQEVIKRADTALYQSKHEGRNRTTIYEFSKK